MTSLFAYVRVSTKKQGEQGVSLGEQRDAIERYAERHGLSISTWFEEQHTASIQGRPKFDQMLRDLTARKATGVIIHKVDRSARNLGDWNEVTELLDRGIDVHVAHDSIDLRSRSGRLMGDIQAVLAADYSRNLSDEVKKGMYGRFKQGLLPRPAPLGYLNNGAGQQKTIDPVAGSLVRQLFEFYATGRYSLRRLTLEADQLGMRGLTGRRLRQTQISCILHNPFYAGVIFVRKTGQHYPGVHEPLVPKALFERVQDVLRGRAPRRVIVNDFLFRRLLTCAQCARRLIGERHKGRVYYRCQVRSCPTTTVREDVTEEHLRQLLEPLQFLPSHREELVATAESQHHDEVAVQRRSEESLRLRLANVTARLDRLTDAYLESSLEKVEFEQRKATLLMERRETEQMMNKGGDAGNPTEAFAKFLELANRAYLLYENANPEERRELIEIVTSNRVVDGRTPMFTLASPFDELAKEAEKHSGGPARSGALLRSTAKSMLRIVSQHLVRTTSSPARNPLSDVNKHCRT